MKSVAEKLLKEDTKRGYRIGLEIKMKAGFQALAVKMAVVDWIRTWFAGAAVEGKAVIGISGGKDSSVVAALCVEALGKDRVIGVLLPNGLQVDFASAQAVINYLEISYLELNLKVAYDSLLSSLAGYTEVSQQTRLNLAPRLRMGALYAVAQSMNGRVANTSNLSERWVGYTTRYGDSVGDFAPLFNFTATEVKLLGKAAGLPTEFIDKVPTDGLSGKSDEENLGFSYELLDQYIRTGVCENLAIKQRIDELYTCNEFKRLPMPCFNWPVAI